MDRRQAIGAMGLLSLWGCETANGFAGEVDATVSTQSKTCSETLEGEIGPYFADDSANGFERSDIRANLDGSDVQTGIPLELTFYIYDASNGCVAYEGAQVDIWHCNASGVYSDIGAEGTSNQQWLRGYQISDASGMVTFKTIVPGWYQGRTTHVHLRIRSTYNNASSTSDGSNTTQVFFPQTLVDTIDTTIAPYASEGKNSTTNASDRVYTDQTQGQNLMSLAGDTTSGYSASFAIYIPIAT
ncbi:MAG: hypothetical protein QM831_03545 [Kofleriaceae bacterium]